MRSTTVQRMALKRFAAPTPMMAEETQCVVDTGMPNSEAARITMAELVSAAKPLMGCSLTILWPSVVMMRQPPPAVPAAMTSAHNTMTHEGMSKPPSVDSGMRRKDSQDGNESKVPAAVAPASASATIPMVFCASFMPCDRPMTAADRICDLPKKEFTNGVRPNRFSRPRRREHQNKNMYSATINTKAMMKPSKGEATMGMTTLGSTPLASHQDASLACHQITAWALLLLPARAAPTKPPTRAWLELEGRPHHHVIRFQMHAPSRALARKIPPSCTRLESTSPSAMVRATAVPISAPSMLVMAAMSTA